MASKGAQQKRSEIENERNVARDRKRATKRQMDTERKAACACAVYPKKGNQNRENIGRAHAKRKTEKEPKERPRGKADQERG